MNIGIVGLGLIGASLAKAVTGHTEHRVFGYNRTAEVTRKALDDGVIFDTLTDENMSNCELIFVSIYSNAAIDYVKSKARFFGCDSVVIDCCGTKSCICGELWPVAAENSFNFIGGHPMAGLAETGYEASDGELFRGAPMILTPHPDVNIDSIIWVEKVLKQMGFGEVVYATPEEHDARIAYTSQLAHILSSAYVMSEKSLLHSGFSAGSFRDLTRVSWLNENMWTELFLDNRTHLLSELEGLIMRLTAFRDAISTGDEQSLRGCLRQGRERKERVDRL